MDSASEPTRGALADEAQRRAWIEAALIEAGSLLSGRQWTLERGGVWPESEMRAAQTFASAHGARGIEWVRDERLPAGVRVRAGSVLIDATISGLLSRRDAIESAFLAEFSRE